MEYKKVHLSDSNEFLSKFSEYEFDMIFADPPYALGSEVIIRKDGKVDYAKASDFMNKWEMPTGLYWEKWFINAYRTLKHGGWLIMYGMDRQTLLFKYYASLAGFDEQQSLYWYFISNFPKATDLSKMIDKNAGVERDVIGSKETRLPGSNLTYKQDEYTQRQRELQEVDITAPKTKLAKKYDGYKYSVAPLKQTCETIMVFKKPNKTGSVLHDTLAMEQGDNTISVSALNIDGNRVEFGNETDSRVGTNAIRGEKQGLSDNNSLFGGNKGINKIGVQMFKEGGRYPAQSFVDDQVASRLDLQSGLNLSQKTTISNKGSIGGGEIYSGTNNDEKREIGYNDIAGCSKILHKIKYELYDHDLFIYEPKVGEAERNNGLEAFESKLSANLPMRSANVDSDSVANDGSKTHRTTTTKNNHPTLKPIDLNSKVLKLFKTPNDQKICYPFAGSGSEIIGGLQAGFSNWVACEINEDYIKIANARIKHYTTHEYVEVPLFDE
jgi:site-specific DNA-methyltransferase (adenine-specific)